MLFTYKRISEANVQAECYHKLRNLGIPSYLDYKVKTESGRICRLDMVILKNIDNQYYVIAIVEFKSSKDLYVNTNTKQYQKYASFGLPLLYCKNYSQINDTILKIQSLYNE